ncbi:MAG: hypothetical protein JW709_05595 [Sedimentisphaerales bacterium]|nr:hypothetical protein [Sedimentisphaerales bacterium]
MQFKEMLANLVLKNISYAGMIDIAEQALVEGYDSPHTRILAGEDKEDFNTFEVHSYFQRMVQELGITLPDVEEAARILIRYWMWCIVEGNVEPKKGAQHINIEVYSNVHCYRKESYVGEAWDLGKTIGILYDYDDVEDIYVGNHGRTITKEQALQQLDDEMRTEARRYLEKYETK